MTAYLITCLLWIVAALLIAGGIWVYPLLHRKAAFAYWDSPAAGGFIYEATATRIRLSWSGLCIYYADPDKPNTRIPDGEIVMRVLPGTTCSFGYPYWDEKTKSLGFAHDRAAAWTAGRIPLSQAPLTAGTAMGAE